MPYLKKQQQIYFSMYHFIDRVLILWEGAILHFLCWNIATPTACITKPVYNKMVFFALVMINALYYWAAHEGNIQSRNESRLCQKKKKTKWWTELPEVFASPIPASMWLIFAGRGRVISGLVANRFGSQFRMSTNLLCGVRAIFVWPWNQNMQTKQKQQTNRNRPIWLVYQMIQTRMAFGWLSKRSGEKKLHAQELSRNQYFTLTS